MGRFNKTKKRTLNPDPLYNSRLVMQLVNKTMKSGKKSIAFKHVYQALEETGKKLKKEPLEILRLALENVKPNMEVRPRRVGGAAYQVPMPVKGDRRLSLALRWLIQAANARPNKEYHTFSEKLTAELLDAYQNTGGAVKKKQDVHRMSEANKAFAHFRW